jgi:hypothetical protein
VMQTWRRLEAEDGRPRMMAVVQDVSPDDRDTMLSAPLLNLCRVSPGLITSAIPATTRDLESVLHDHNVGIVVTLTLLPLFVPEDPTSCWIAVQNREVAITEGFVREPHSRFHAACTLAAAAGVEFLHVPVPDGAVPAVESLQLICRTVDRVLESRSGSSVWVHCWAGKFRARAVAAALLGLCPALQTATTSLHPRACIEIARQEMQQMLEPETRPTAMPTRLHPFGTNFKARHAHRDLLLNGPVTFLQKCDRDYVLYTLEPWLWWTHLSWSAPVMPSRPCEEDDTSGEVRTLAVQPVNLDLEFVRRTLNDPSVPTVVNSLVSFATKMPPRKWETWDAGMQWLMPACARVLGGAWWTPSQYPRLCGPRSTEFIAHALAESSRNLTGLHVEPSASASSPSGNGLRGCSAAHEPVAGDECAGGTAATSSISARPGQCVPLTLTIRVDLRMAYVVSRPIEEEDSLLVATSGALLLRSQIPECPAIAVHA